MDLLRSSFMQDCSIDQQDWLKNLDRFGFPSKGVIDINNRYVTNSYGFRGNNFRCNQDIVALGCSFTFGMGVPQEEIWCSISARKLGLGIDNLGIPGAGFRRIIMTFISYCNIYGPPKTVFALLPDFNRFRYLGDDLVASDLFIPKFSKAPHDLSDILTEKMALWDAMSMAYVLEGFCKVSGIRLIWTSWDGNTHEYIHTMVNNRSQAFSNFINIEKIIRGTNWAHEDWPVKFYPHFQDCHQELKEKYPKFFSIGGDIEEGNPHWGVHKHYHIAEAFTDAYLGG